MNPIGTITLWHGAIVDIPGGWLICDGANGTPDLRDRFVIGAGSTYAPDASGGAVNHTHGFTGTGHNHGVTTTTDVTPGSGLTVWDAGTDAGLTCSETAGGTSDSDGSLQPYYALAYIKRVA